MNGYDLIEGKSYLMNDKYYFRFTKLENNTIHCTGYYIRKNDGYRKTKNTEFIYYHIDQIFKEVFFEEFSKYLPNNHEDIIFFRKEKIINLLKNKLI